MSLPGCVFIDDNFDVDKEWNESSVYETTPSDDGCCSTDDDDSDSDNVSVDTLKSYLSPILSLQIRGEERTW